MVLPVGQMPDSHSDAENRSFYASDQRAARLLTAAAPTIYEKSKRLRFCYSFDCTLSFYYRPLVCFVKQFLVHTALFASLLLNFEMGLCFCCPCSCCSQTTVAVQGAAPAAGASFTVRYFSAKPNQGDWIGIFPGNSVGSSGYLSWISIDATQKSGIVTLTAPYQSGHYVLRYVSQGPNGEQVAASRDFRVM
jgi:hypothetical protein